MLPIIGAAIGLVQQNQKDKEARKLAMQQAAMGRFSEGGPPAAGSDKSGALLGLGQSLLGGEEPAAPAQMPVGPDGAQQLTPGTAGELDDALGALDRYKGW